MRKKWLADMHVYEETPRLADIHKSAETKRLADMHEYAETKRLADMHGYTETMNFKLLVKFPYITSRIRASKVFLVQFNLDIINSTTGPIKFNKYSDNT
jgi:hypothetical protein